jgi:spermidine synthase
MQSSDMPEYVERKGKRKRQEKPTYALEFKAIAGKTWFFREWSTWGRYPTLKQAQQALAQKSSDLHFQFRIVPIG